MNDRTGSRIGRRALLAAALTLPAVGSAAVTALAAPDKLSRPSPSPPPDQPPRNGPALSIRDRGAIGDGRSHPLSERYKSLEAARRVHPHARSLDQECDWAALQGAVLELSRTGQGGTVLVPPGQYRLDGEIVLPNLDRYDDAFNEVEIVGAGMRASLLSWPEIWGRAVSPSVPAVGRPPATTTRAISAAASPISACADRSPATGRAMRRQAWAGWP
ncbi:hypothetical protein ABNQ38_10200 [Azospirillum sp. A29]|uniref:hypothetical protein n=1 Tax=Azospirillum sp. A29 TaxID=3160606 RepID=UPI00366CFF1A